MCKSKWKKKLPPAVLNQSYIAWKYLGEIFYSPLSYPLLTLSLIKYVTVTDELSEGEVLVKLVSSSICNSDVHTLQVISSQG